MPAHQNEKAGNIVERSF